MADNVTLILNIVLVAMIVIVVIATLIGLWKGIWKTSFKLIFRSILFIIMIFCAQPITSAICSMNIKTTFGINGTIMGVPLTSLDQTLANILLKNYEISPIAGYDLYSTALLLSHSILSCIIFFVLALLTFLIGSVFATIFYHLIFKHIIPKKAQKRKIRWAGAVCGFIDGFLCMVMLISPLSSMMNTAVKAEPLVTKSNDLKIIDDGTYSSIMSGIEGYNNSALFTTMKIFNPLSDAMINKVVEVEINGAKMGLIDEFETLVDLFKPLMDHLSSGENGVSINYQTILLKETIAELTKIVSSSKLIVNMIPGLISMGQHMIEDPLTKKIIMGLDFKDIDFKNDLGAINEFYGKLYDAGLFSRVDSDKFNLTIYLENIDLYAEALKSITSIEMISNNLSQIMSFTADEINKKLGESVFPTSQNAYADIDWDNDLACILNCAAQLVKTLDIKTLDNLDINSLLTDALKNEEKREGISLAFCGNDTQKGLFDAKLVESLDLKTLVIKILSSVPEITDYIDEDDLYDLFDKKTIKLKDEFKIIFELIPLVFGNDNLPLDSIDLANETHISELKKLVKVASKSELLTRILPRLLKSNLSDANISKDMLFGLSIDDLNFNFSSPAMMEEEFNLLLDTIKNALEISKQISGSDESQSLQDTIGKIDTEKLKTVLVNLYTSKIINPSHRISGSDEYENDRNFIALVKGILSEQSIKDLGVVVPNNLDKIIWYDEKTNTGEIINIVDSFAVLKNHLDFFDSSDITFEKIEGSMIKEILQGLGKSYVFSSSLASIFNKNISPILKDLGVEVDFSIVQNWENEGDCFEKIINSLKAISKDGGLDKIDWLNSDLTRVNAILTAFAQTEIMSVQQLDTGLFFDNFGNLLSSVMNNDSFKGVLGSSINSSIFQTCDPTTGLNNRGWTWVEEKKVIKILEEDVEISTKGEIYNLINLLEKINNAGVDNIKGDSIDPVLLKDILLSLVETNTLHIVIGDLLENAIANTEAIVLDEDNSIDLKKLNTDVLFAMSKEELRTEIEYLIHIYDQFTSGVLESLLAQDQVMNLSKEQLDSLKVILDDFASLKTFTTNIEGERLSLHEEILSSIFNFIRLDQMVTNHVAKDDDSAQVQKEKKLKAKASMQSIITSVTDWLDYQDASGQVVLNENSKIIRFLERANGIDIEQVNAFSSLNPDQVASILTSLNDSKILHQAIPTFIQQAFEVFYIDQLTTINGKKYYDINYRVHLTTSEEDIAYWDQELSVFLELTRNIYYIDSEGGHYLDSSELGFNTDIFNLYNILSPIDRMQLLNENKEYILLSYILNTDIPSSDGTSKSLIDLIRDMPSNANEHIKAARIRRLFFNYGHSDDDLRLQCDILNNFLKNLSSMISVDFSKDNLEIDGQQAYDFIMDTMAIINNNGEVGAFKSLFASEVVASFFNNGFSSAVNDSESAKVMETFFFERDEMQREYFRLNIVEARGVKGLLDLTKAKTQQEMADAISLMGSYPETISNMTLEDSGYSEEDKDSLALLKKVSNMYYSDYSVKRSDVNSNLALMLFDEYMPDSTAFKSFYTLYLNTQCDGSIDNLVFEDLAYSIRHYDSSNPTHIPVNPNRP